MSEVARSNEGLDRIRQPLLIAILLGLALVLPLREIVEFDIWAHLRTGEWIWQHAAVPQTDPFTVGGEDKPFVAYYWLFSWVTYLCYESLGLSGISLLRLALSAGFTLLLFRLLYRRSHQFSIAFVLSCLAVAACVGMLTFTRSWLATMCLFVVNLEAVLRVRDASPLRSVAWLPLLYVLWANVHIQFVYGLWTLFLLACEPGAMCVLSRPTSGELRVVIRRIVQRMGLVGACVLATLVNPYGVGIYETLWKYAAERKYLSVILEFNAPSFRSWDDWLMLVLVLAASFAMGWRRARVPLQMMLFATAVYVSFQAVRDTWLVVIVSVWILSEARWDKWLADTPPPPGNRKRIAIAGALTIGLLASVVLFLQPYYERRIKEIFPVSVARYIQGQQLEGPLYTTYGWGGYFLWQLPKIGVFLDGRAQVHGLAAVKQNQDTWRGLPGWNSDADLQKANLIAGPPDAALMSLLDADPAFQRLFEDEVAVLFQRRPNDAARGTSLTIEPGGGK